LLIILLFLLVTKLQHGLFSIVTLHLISFTELIFLGSAMNRKPLGGRGNLGHLGNVPSVDDALKPLQGSNVVIKL